MYKWKIFSHFWGVAPTDFQVLSCPSSLLFFGTTFFSTFWVSQFVCCFLEIIFWLLWRLVWESPSPLAGAPLSVCLDFSRPSYSHKKISGIFTLRYFTRNEWLVLIAIFLYLGICWQKSINMFSDLNFSLNNN